MKGVSSKRIAFSRRDIGPEIHCLQARTCIFQAGNFTGWGSGGVKQDVKQLYVKYRRPGIREWIASVGKHDQLARKGVTSAAEYVTVTDSIVSVYFCI